LNQKVVFRALARDQPGNAEPGKLRRIIIIFHQTGGDTGRFAYSAVGNCAMICKPVASQNIDDRSAQGHFPVWVAAIVEYHVFLECQNTKYGIGALALFVHGDDQRSMAFEPSVVTHVAALTRRGNRLIAVCANLVRLPSHFFSLQRVTLAQLRLSARSRHRK